MTKRPLHLIAGNARNLKGWTDSTTGIVRTRVSTLRPRKNMIAVMLPRDLHALLKVYAASEGLFLEEAVAAIVAEGLADRQGWQIHITDDKSPIARVLKFNRSAKRSADEIATMTLTDRLIEKGCKPEEITISAPKHPNLKLWCKEKGIRYHRHQTVAIQFPREFDKLL